MERYWEVSADRLQRVMSAVPGLDECRDEDIQQRIREAERIADDEIRPLLKRFAEMENRLFMDIVATWRHKYRR